MTEFLSGADHHHARLTLRGFREANMLTQAEAAERIGTTRQTIAAWETGKRRPSAADLARLARAYRLHLSDLAQCVEVGEAAPAGVQEGE